jgi:CRP/FNR family transcriptional regulator, cyclic AMP receptor protein
MREKFEGKAGEQKRIEALMDQYIINGRKEFAEFFANNCEVIAVTRGSLIIEQDGHDNDLYFIISGGVEVYVNDRIIASREKRNHVGEMALLDDTAKRSASVVAREETVLFRVQQDVFAKFADANPVLWRRIAIELSSRLRERSKFIKVPNPKPLVFIGSSSESLLKAKLVKQTIRDAGIEVKCWDDSELFALSESTLDELVSILTEYDFALFFVSGDDQLIGREKERAQPRDNVILELGMSIGALGKERTFILLDEKSRPNLPSDLKGVTYLPIRFEGDKLSNESFALIETKLIERIIAAGVK